MHWAEVELHSTVPEAVAAVRATVQMLQGGELLELDGRYYVPCGFVVWACVHQGYVKQEVVRAGCTADGTVVPGPEETRPRGEVEIVRGPARLALGDGPPIGRKAGGT